MDEYVSKPLRPSDLADAMNRVLAKDTAPKRPTPPYPDQESRAFDINTALAVANGDETFLKHMADMFREQSPKLLEEIHDAVVRQDMDSIKRAAHKLKAI